MLVGPDLVCVPFGLSALCCGFFPVSLCWQGLGLAWKSKHRLWSAELNLRALQIPVVLLLVSSGAFVF